MYCYNPRRDPLRANTKQSWTWTREGQSHPTTCQSPVSVQHGNSCYEYYNEQVHGTAQNGTGNNMKVTKLQLLVNTTNEFLKKWINYGKIKPCRTWTTWRAGWGYLILLTAKDASLDRWMGGNEVLSPCSHSPCCLDPVGELCCVCVTECLCFECVDCVCE